jgi:hypothetical protein
MMRGRIALLTVLLPLAACGDGGLSADEYRERLDAACAQLAKESSEIPQTVRDQDLDLEGARELADEAGNRFEDTLTDLDPPGDLEDAHEALLDIGDETPPSGEDREGVRHWTLRIAEIYDDLGAQGCAEGQRRAAEEMAESAG